MNDVKNFRDQYNFSQSFLAAALNITKSQLSMVELGLRRLKKDAVERLRFLERQMLPAAQRQTASAMPGKCAEFQKTDDQGVQRFLEEDILVSRHELSKIIREVSGLLQRRQKAFAAVALTDTIRQQESRSGEIAPDPQWTNMAEVAARMVIEHIPTEKILSLELKIAGLEAKLEVANKKLNLLKRASVLFVEPKAKATAVISATPLPDLKASIAGEQRTPAVHIPASKPPLIRNVDSGTRRKTIAGEDKRLQSRRDRTPCISRNSHVIPKRVVINNCNYTEKKLQAQKGRFRSDPTLTLDLHNPIAPVTVAALRQTR